MQSVDSYYKSIVWSVLDNSGNIGMASALNVEQDPSVAVAMATHPRPLSAEAASARR
jgi:hypothetical protein